MGSLVCDIAFSRLKRAFDDAFCDYGLLVTRLQFDDTDRLPVIIEFNSEENEIIPDAC